MAISAVTSFSQRHSSVYRPAVRLLLTVLITSRNVDGVVLAGDRV